MKKIALLGSTGSIGTQVLDVVSEHSEHFEVVSLAAGKNIDLLARQIAKFAPKVVSIQHANQKDELLKRLKILAPNQQVDILSGDEGLIQLAEDNNIDTLVVGLVGLTGLAPSLAALKKGKKLLTANKETFVAGGHLVAPYLNQVIPIDSEHSAIHQCLHQQAPDCLKTLYLTASGGPFRQHSKDGLKNVSLDEALKHPNWDMGTKITIDSATMMNKGLEVIEAHWLFGASYDQINIVVHPQSIIHSAVQFVDNSILAQLGAPDMRVPIQYAMTYPKRLPAPYPTSELDLMSLSQLDFEPSDPDRFPCVRLAYEAGRAGSHATAVLNAADEMAVQLFLDEKISFTQIPELIETTLNKIDSTSTSALPTLEEIQELDSWARKQVLKEAELVTV